jgi:hypothetical protein
MLLCQGKQDCGERVVGDQYQYTYAPDGPESSRGNHSHLVPATR